jgi:hypothetical protein
VPGSSPSSSSTMTTSRTVTSPDSTGSDSGAAGFYSVPTYPYVAEPDAETMAFCRECSCCWSDQRIHIDRNRFGGCTDNTE